MVCRYWPLNRMQGVPDVMCMFHVIRNGDLPLVGNSAEYRDDPEKNFNPTYFER